MGFPSDSVDLKTSDVFRTGKFSIGTFVLVQAYIIRLSNQLWSFSRIVRDIYESFADAKAIVYLTRFLIGCLYVLRGGIEAVLRYL